MKQRFVNLLILGVIATGLLMPSAARAQDAPVLALVAETAPVPDSQVPQNVKEAVNAADRPSEDKALDSGRKPEQLLAFFGIRPGMKVADLSAGGGYTTELLSRAVGPSGTVYSQNGPFPEKYKDIGDKWRARLKNPALKNVVEIDKGFDSDFLPVPPGSLNVVLINLNYHDLVGFKADREKINAQIFKALKPGGTYGIVDHSAQQGSGARDTATLHRIDEILVVQEVENAGFKLAARSSALRHPEDDRTWFVFKRRGETDRFVLAFQKPM